MGLEGIPLIIPRNVVTRIGKAQFVISGFSEMLEKGISLIVQFSLMNRLGQFLIESNQVTSDSQQQREPFLFSTIHRLTFGQGAFHDRQSIGRHA